MKSVSVMTLCFQMFLMCSKKESTCSFHFQQVTQGFSHSFLHTSSICLICHLTMKFPAKTPATSARKADLQTFSLLPLFQIQFSNLIPRATTYRRMQINTDFSLCTKFNSKWTTCLSTKSDMLILIEENIGESFELNGTRKKFLKRTSIGQEFIKL